MRLDFRSVVFSIGFMMLMVAILLSAYALAIKPRRREMYLWSIAFTLLFVGQLTIAFQGILPDFLGIVVADCLLLGSYLFILIGIRRFNGKATPWYLAAAVFAAIAAWMAHFTFAQPSMLHRLVFYDAALVALAAMGSVEVARRKETGANPHSRTASILLCAISLLYLLRLVLTLLFGAPATLMESSSWDALIQALSGGLVSILAITFILIYLSMLNGDLAKAAQERALMVREMAHRTKNDLALVDSLLSIEQSILEEEALQGGPDRIGTAAEGGNPPNMRIGALRERIHCLARAHDRLSRSDDPGAIRLDEYLELIALGLPHGSRVDMVRDFAPTKAPFAFAAPLGLIMNELATNAAKYAFPDGKMGHIRLSLHDSGNAAAGPSLRRTMFLEVRDDGIGAGWPPEKQGFGTMIVQAFAAKIEADIAYSFEGGSVFRVRFELPLPFEAWRA